MQEKSTRNHASQEQEKGHVYMYHLFQNDLISRVPERFLQSKTTWVSFTRVTGGNNQWGVFTTLLAARIVHNQGLLLVLRCIARCAIQAQESLLAEMLRSRKPHAVSSKAWRLAASCGRLALGSPYKSVLRSGLASLASLALAWKERNHVKDT